MGAGWGEGRQVRDGVKEGTIIGECQGGAVSTNAIEKRPNGDALLLCSVFEHTLTFSCVAAVSC